MDFSKLTLQIFSNLEHKWLSTNKTRILTIDGGGTSPIVAGTSLIYLENQIQIKTSNPQARITDFFDLIAGTGIGAILASLLVAADNSGHPLFTAKQAVNFIAINNSEMFKTNQSGLFRRQRRRRLSSGKSIDKILKEAFKSLTLKDAIKPLLVPCFDLKTSAPFVFSRADANESSSFNFELWKVCRAASAMPNLFKPFNLTSVDGKTACCGIDGGLVMNNPTAAAVTHVLHNKIDFPLVNSVEDLLVLSLGNGRNGNGNGNGNGGFSSSSSSSSSSVVGIVVDGVSETIDQMLGNAFSWNSADYVRIQVNNGWENGGLGEDGAELLKEKGSETVPFGGKRLVKETNGERIERLVERLIGLGSGNTNLSLPPSPCKN